MCLGLISAFFVVEYAPPCSQPTYYLILFLIKVIIMAKIIYPS